ncbi:MAG TPA: hypothetical protein VF472_14185 [Burkholderiaceae bacterium]
MSIALGTILSNAASAQAGAGSGVALQAQLDRCTRQLSDWVNCASGKTPEGKQIIAALQDKISSIKQQLQRQDRGDGQNGQNAAPVSPPASLALASTGSVGTILNTVA